MPSNKHRYSVTTPKDLEDLIENEAAERHIAPATLIVSHLYEHYAALMLKTSVNVHASRVSVDEKHEQRKVG